jgi:hypothetical protein
MASVFGPSAGRQGWLGAADGGTPQLRRRLSPLGSGAAALMLIRRPAAESEAKSATNGILREMSVSLHAFVHLGRASAIPNIGTC